MSNTLTVNRKSVTIPGDAWRLVGAKPAYKGTPIFREFVITDDEGNEAHGNVGDYIVELSSGAWVIVPAQLYERLFTELGAS